MGITRGANEVRDVHDLFRRLPGVRRDFASSLPPPVPYGMRDDLDGYLQHVSLSMQVAARGLEARRQPERKPERKRTAMIFADFERVWLAWCCYRGSSGP